VNLDTGQIKNWGWASGKASVLSEFGTMQMEFEYLSLVTGDNRFKDMINFVINKVIQVRHRCCVL
jgi:mannosyl-oligosaccharide alpha-1,2-mannosidase